MKKTFSLILAFTLLLFAFSGCGKDEADNSFAGRYNGLSVKILNNDTPIEEVYPNGENSVELLEDMTGIFALDGEEINITFTIEGQNISISAADGPGDQLCKGTLSGNVLQFDFFGRGIEMTFTR